MKRTNIEQHYLIESKVNDILYKDLSCNKAFAAIVFSKDINKRRNYLTKLVENIILKFNLY